MMEVKLNEKPKIQLIIAHSMSQSQKKQKTNCGSSSWKKIIAHKFERCMNRSEIQGVCVCNDFHTITIVDDDDGDFLLITLLWIMIFVVKHE